MTTRKTSETTQMNLLFCDSKPMMLPDDKQRELAIALADLLLNAATEPSRSGSRGGCSKTAKARRTWAQNGTHLIPQTFEKRVVLPVSY